MSVERNAPCPCGSGKKYKKCCLSKDQAAARAKAAADAQAAETARQAEEAAREAQREQAAREWEEKRKSESPFDSDKEAAESEDSYEPDWPPLPAEDQQLVDAWWKEVGPVYTGRGAKENSGWLLERTLEFVQQQPRLFRYLYLHDEFLFELGGALARAGRLEDYLALLRRLRREQPDTYFQCFGYYDLDLMAEAIRTRRREEIPACLDLFRQHPVNHIDQFAGVVDLLAWCGYETELRELLLGTAQQIADSPKVFGGGFGLRWLDILVMVPFLEAGDDSPQAVDQWTQAERAAGCLTEDELLHREWWQRAVRAASRTPTEAGLDLKKAQNKWFQSNVSWTFTGWVRRTKSLSWSSARFLAIALLDYWAWNDRERKKGQDLFGLNETRLEHYLARHCRDLIGLEGLPALSTLQAFHYFTEYLAAHGYFDAAEARELQSAAAGLYETVRGAVDACDPAYRIFPTYEALVAGFTLPCLPMGLDEAEPLF